MTFSLPNVSNIEDKVGIDLGIIDDITSTDVVVVQCDMIGFFERSWLRIDLQNSPKFGGFLSILKIVTPEEKQLRLTLEQLGNFWNNQATF